MRLRQIVLVVLVFFAGCATHSSPAPFSGHSLTVAVHKEPASLNPLLLEGITAYIVSEFFYSYLTQYDEDGRIVPQLALTVPSSANGGVSDGGKRIVFRLRGGVRWQDGTPVTARDVAATYHAIMNPSNRVPSRYPYDAITSITTPDDRTVIITLRRPFSPMISYFFGGDSNYPVLQARALAGATINAATVNSVPIADGPYRLASWEHGNRMTLSANASYYRGKPPIAQLKVPFVQDDATEINELRTGEIDMAYMLDASRIDELRKIPNHRVMVTPVPFFAALAFNMRDAVLSDIAVRRAFSLAIDRETLTRKITKDAYNARTGPRGLFTWAYDPHVDRLHYDPAAAAHLLDAAGWRAGSDGIRVKNAERLHLELAFPTGRPITARLATGIAAAERSIGIEVSLHQYDYTFFLSHDGPLMQGRYQVSLYEYQSTYDPDASWLLSCDQAAPRGFNFARYCNAGVDAALVRGAGSFDRPTRAKSYAAVQQQIARDLPYLFICQVSEVDVLPAPLKGYARPLLSPFVSVGNWRL